MQDTADLIPHRGRWKIAQRIVSMDESSAVAEGDFDEAWVEGHFPGRPIVPGVALLEGLAQTMLALSHHLDPDPDGTPFLAAMDKVRFRTPVIPPATVRFEVTLRGHRAGMTSAVGTATWGGEVVCTAKLTGAVVSHP